MLARALPRRAASPLAGPSLDRRGGPATALLFGGAGGELVPNPGRDTVVQPGDVVVMFGEPGALRPVE